MLRRPATRLGLAATARLLATPGNAVSEVKEPKKTREVVEPVSADFKPPASEAPELLQPYVEPTPFIHPRTLQVFTVSLSVGAATVAVLYLLFSKSLSDTAEEEDATLEELRDKCRADVGNRPRVFAFATPSSHEELQQLMQSRNKELERQEANLRARTSVFHTEMTFRLKMWWNRSLSHIQAAASEYMERRAQRKESNTRATIEATLRQSGYTLVDLEVVKSA